jgi:hypothetical protein
MVTRNSAPHTLASRTSPLGTARLSSAGTGNGATREVSVVRAHITAVNKARAAARVKVPETAPARSARSHQMAPWWSLTTDQCTRWIPRQSPDSSWSTGDPIAAAQAGDSITNLSNGDQVTVTSVGKSSDANPYSGTGDHTQDTNSSDGSVIVLEDGSIWEVSASDQPTAAIWNDDSSITVNETSSGSSYELVNTDDQATVQANYLGNE